jgi:hypothetical protein
MAGLNVELGSAGVGVVGGDEGPNVAGGFTGDGLVSIGPTPSPGGFPRNGGGNGDGMLRGGGCHRTRFRPPTTLPTNPPKNPHGLPVTGSGTYFRFCIRRSFAMNAFAWALPFTNLRALPPAAFFARRFTFATAFFARRFTLRTARRTGEPARAVACIAAVWKVIGLIPMCGVLKSGLVGATRNDSQPLSELCLRQVRIIDPRVACSLGPPALAPVCALRKGGVAGRQGVQVVVQLANGNFETLHPLP